MVDVRGIKFLPLEKSEERIEHDQRESDGLSKILPPLAPCFLGGLSLYSIYCGVWNMKRVGNLGRGRVFFYGGVCGWLFGWWWLFKILGEIM